MLKRENEFENDGKMKEMKDKYNFQELFENIVLKKDEDNEKKSSK